MQVISVQKLHNRFTFQSTSTSSVDFRAISIMSKLLIEIEDYNPLFLKRSITTNFERYLLQSNLKGTCTPASRPLIQF